MKDIKVAIVGVGNCASSLIQGITYYKDVDDNSPTVPGLMHNVLGGYKISDIRFVAAIDVDSKKVGRDLSEAIFAEPNCTVKFSDVPPLGVKVRKGPVLDGVAETTREKFAVDQRQKPEDVEAILRQSKPDVLVSYLPVGSEEATRYYAEVCLSLGIGFINAIPVFIASSPEWAKRFEEKKIPIVGDDIKSQVGATIVHRTLTKLFVDRGVTLDNTYQLNVGGNTDFLNMQEKARLKSKKISKTQSVQSQLPIKMPAEDIHIGPSDYVPWLKDKKLCFIRMEGRNFGDVPLNLEIRLEVEDSPNSAGVIVDAIRCAKIALDRGIGGALLSPSSYFMKSPPEQYSDPEARSAVEDFIAGRKER